jgi:hypothetical protein
MARMPSRCPACSQDLEVSRLSCPGCQMNLEGRFALPELLRLSAEEQAFAVAFVLASGSLKDLGEQLKVSYPTVRNRLNELIENLKASATDQDAERKKVLDALAKGDLTVKEASRRLGELR